MNLMADDKRAFLTAAAQAQLAVDWLLAKSPPPSLGAAVDAQGGKASHRGAAAA